MFDDATQNGFTARYFLVRRFLDLGSCRALDLGKAKQRFRIDPAVQITIAEVRADMDVARTYAMTPSWMAPFSQAHTKVGTGRLLLDSRLQQGMRRPGQRGQGHPLGSAVLGEAAEQPPGLPPIPMPTLPGPGGPMDWLSVPDTEDAIEVIKWFGAEIARVAPAAGQTDLVKDANRLSAHLWRAVTGRDAKVHPNQNATVSIGVVQSRQSSPAWGRTRNTKSLS